MCRNMTAALTLAVLAWTGAGVSPPQSFAAGGTIAGVAVDPVTGRAVEGAVASVPLGLETRTATTDSSGRFILGDMPAGRGFRVFITRKGHRTATLTTDVSPDDTSRVRVELPSVYLSLSSCPDPVHLVAGTDFPVRWESGGMETVRIEFSADGGERWLLLVERTDASSGEWTWPVPDIPTSRGMFRITAPDRPGIEALSGIYIIITST